MTISTRSFTSRSRRFQIASRPRRQSGLATLIVIMLLFFIIALVAAYTSRNIIFEQRASANLYRSTQAFEAAEAGVQWTLALLNAGRIDDKCLPTADQTKSTFRARYIDSIDNTGAVTLRMRTSGSALMPTCTFDAATNRWSCLCPSDAAAALPDVAGASAKPMFRIQLKAIAASGARSDSFQVISAGCTRPDDNCLVADTPSAPAGDAIAVVSAVVTLRSGLSTPPAAAVTARQSINGGIGPLRAVNLDTASGGATFLSGGGINGNVQAQTLSGTPGSASLLAGDPTLSGIVPAGPVPNAGDRFFSMVFGMAPGVYSQQPAAMVVDCSAGCTAASVDALAKQFPERVLWLNGDLNVNGNIGSPLVAGSMLAAEVAASGPVVLVVTGQVTLSSGIVYGAVYCRSANWDRGGGNAQVQGALIAEGNLGGDGAQSISYDANILTRLRTWHGSFVRVNGGWRDF